MAEEKRENTSNISENELAKKATDTLLVDENNQTIDIYDLLEHNTTDSAVIKINNLIEYSEITQEIVAEKYGEVAGNITNKDLALLALDSVFLELAISETEKPNGRVFDLSTGKLDEELSQEQAEALGLDSDSSSHPNISKEEIVQASIEKSLIKYRERMEATKAANKSEFANKQDDFYTLPSKDYTRLLKEYSEKHAYTDAQKEKKMNEYKERGYDDDVSKIIVGADDDITKIDPGLIMMTKLAINLEAAKGTLRFNNELDKLNKFLNQNPKYKEIYPQIIDENKNVRQEYKDQVTDYEDKLGLYEFFNKTKNLDKDVIPYLGKDHKKQLTTYFMAAFNQLSPNNPLHEQIIENMKMIFPEFDDIAKEGNRFDIPKLCEFLEQTLELDSPLEPNKLKRLSNICKDKVLRKRYHDDKINAIVNGEETNEKFSDEKFSDEEFDNWFGKNSVELNIDINEALRENTEKNEEEKYFESSKMFEFSEKDSSVLKRTYKLFNSKSWIDEKQTAVKLSFLSLVTLKRNLENLGKESPFYAQKLEEVENKIEEMKTANSEIDFDQYLGAKGSIREPYKSEIDNYGRSKMSEKVLYDYIADEEIVRNREDYDKLSKEDKQEYLLNCMAFMNTKRGHKTTLFKFIARRLEIIDSEENGMLSLEKNEDGEMVPHINTDKLLEEYNKTSSHRFKSFEELMTYTSVKKMEYISDKLDEYSNLREEDFFKLTATTPKERSNEIENIRMNFNLHIRDESNIGEQTHTNVTESKTQSEVVTEQNQSTTTVTKSENEARNEQNQKSDESGNKENDKTSEAEYELNNTMSQDNEKALTVTEKPSFFDRLKNIFSMLTNLTQRPKTIYSNNQRDNEGNAMPSVSDVSGTKDINFVEKVTVNTLEAVESFNSQQGSKQQAQKADKESEGR